MNLTLKTKAALVTTLVVLATVSLAGGWLYRQQARDHVALLRSQQDTLASAMAANLDFKLAASLAALAGAARRVDAAVLTSPAAQARFFEANALRPPFNGVAIVGDDGMVALNDPPNTAPVNIGDRDYFRQARVTGQPTISAPVLSRSNGHPVVLMAVPLFDANHRFIGALAGGLDLLSDNALGDLGHAHVGASGHYEVVTRDLSPLYVMHPDPALLMKPAANLATPDDLDTGRDFVTRRTLRHVPWELRIVIPAHEAFGPLQRARRTLLLALLLTGIGTVLAVSAGLGWLMRPLETLWRSMREQRRTPDVVVPIDTRANDERGQLAREFEGLMHELRAQRAELAAVSDTSPLGLFRAGLDGRLSYVNDAYLRIHGFADRDEAAEGWIGMLPKDDQDEARQAWRRIVTEPVGMHVTRRLQRADGRTIVVVVRSAPIVIDGRVQGHVGTVADVTERIEGDRALRTQAAIFEATTDFVVQTDHKGRLLYVNPAARRMMGLAPDAPIKHLTALSFNPPATVARHAVEIVPTAVDKGVWAGETVQWDAQHREVLVSHLLLAHKDRHGRVEAFSAILRDITAQKSAQQALHRSEAVLRSLTEVVPMAIAVVDKTQRCVFVNQGFEAWVGRPRDQLLGHTAEEVVGAEEYAIRRPWIERVLAGERLTFERDDPSREQHRHVRVDYIPLFDEAGEVEGFVAVTTDISAARAEERRLRDLAQTDPLTQVLNRTGFQRALDDRAARAPDEAPDALVALLYIDLDRFKPVNDLYGHAVGDQLLQMFARRLRQLVRPTDLIARLGGDEFVLVIDGLHEEANAMIVADKVVAAAELPFELPAGTLQVSASVGVACWRPGDAATAGGWTQALERADAMLYRAKAAGRGHAVANATMDA
ncbi:PAS domain-containing protein [Ideonella sp.]|uniref:PAS domain-containing protein n=1 Tax=Ideonella sp. TaxID=1929293 RepID=UPI0035B1AD12